MQKLSEIVHAAHLLHECRQQVFFLVVTLLVDIIAEVTLVFLLRVDQSLNGIVAGLHAELDSLVQNLLRLIRCVDISLGKRLDVLLVMVDSSIDDAVTDGLGDDLLGLLNTFEAKLSSDVSHGNL